MSTPFASVTILKTRIADLGMDQTLERISRMASQSSPRHIITANVDQVVANCREPSFRAIYRNAALVLADGVPLLWASRFLKRPLRERINGTDLMERICAMAAQRNFPVFLLGGPEGVAERCAAVLKERYPGLRVAGAYFPFYGFEKDDQENGRICALLREKGTVLLFTSLGFPKGIQWIDRHQAGCGIPLAIEVGASFSFISGALRRAPLWMQKRGLEWFWRLMQEPRRLWKRYLVRDMPFFYYLLKQKFFAE
jgi:N-acetylglucosaminyldiphosphoundecaprenol N-acetyl-beta-D-mannosaminyltransferase